MKDVLDYLDERIAEFERHLSIARILQERVDDINRDIQVEVRHVNTIKSGLLIHLYNIVEAIMTRTLENVGQTVLTERPKYWTESILKEWVRAEIWTGEERLGEGAVRRLTEVVGTLASGNSPTEFVVKGESGSWNDKSIKKVAERLGCTLVLTRGIKRAAYERVYRDETTALTYLARRRNAIAHGETTFEDGANDITLDELAKLGDRVLPYLQAVVISYHAFLADKKFLTPEEPSP